METLDIIPTMRQALLDALLTRLTANGAAARARGFPAVAAMYDELISDLKAAGGNPDNVWDLLSNAKGEIIDHLERSGPDEEQRHKEHPAVLCCMDAEGMVSVGNQILWAAAPMTPEEAMENVDDCFGAYAFDPNNLGFRMVPEEYETMEDDEGDRQPPPPRRETRLSDGWGGPPAPITPTPFQWIDPVRLPRRQWLYGKHLIRGFVSLTIAPGATGKSSLLVADVLAMVTGRDLLGTSVYGGPKRVWLFNLEDPMDEMQRRLMATALHYGVGPEDIGGRLWLDSGRQQGLCLAKQDKSGTIILVPVVENLVTVIVERGIDVLVVDPFVSSHTVPENDNGAIDAVAKQWGAIADRTGCAIELVHHLRKMGGYEATAESARGAVALVAAARSVRVLNKMAPEEAEAAGLLSHRSHFRVTDDKNNLVAPCDKAEWFQIVSVDLGNGGTMRVKGQEVPLPGGDSIGVVVTWKWPDPFADITAADLLAVQKAIDGKGYRENVQAKDWVGNTIAEVLQLDPTDKAVRRRVSALISTWIKNGALTITSAPDKKGIPRPIVAVGGWAVGVTPTTLKSRV